MLRTIRGYSICMLMPALGVASLARAQEDIEFVAEHLPEAAMDNRYATLPLWNLTDSSEGAAYQVQGAYARSTSGDLSIAGPLFSFSVRRPLGPNTQLGAFGFYDSLQLRADHDSRPLQTLFAPTTPIARPVPAEFSNLDGTATDVGGGLFWSRRVGEGWLGEHHWTAGLLWQRVRLQDYRFDYRITSGPQSGLSGQIDFDAHYDHFAPFVGVEMPRTHGNWVFTPHALFVYPTPRRGFQGHITGPDFDISGDTEDVGNGKHFGDPSLTLGLTLTYTPAHLSIDAGTLLSQAFLEGWIHRGIDSNWLLSVSWAP